MSRQLFVALRLSLASATCAGAALAQKGDAVLLGRVFDKSTGAPVARADIVNMADSRVVVSDSAGTYQFADLMTGIVRLRVRAAGFPLTTVVVALARGERMTKNIELDSSLATGGSTVAQPLPGVSVTAPVSLGPRYVDFERRRLTGRGHYLTREEIEKAGYSNLQDAVRGMRGVNVECGGGLGCHIRMSRAPMQCLPDYIVDEHVQNNFGPSTAIRDIEGLEVYTGPSDVPGEFAGRNAGCGVIVIWTRAGPPPKKKPQGALKPIWSLRISREPVSGEPERGG